MQQKNVAHVTEKADVLLWQLQLEEPFSGSCEEETNFLGIMAHGKSTEKHISVRNGRN